MTTMTSLTLPARIHAQIITGRNASTGVTERSGIVWADRVTSKCGLCGQPVPKNTGCPVIMGQLGDVQELSQQHGCGQWLHVAWAETIADEDAITALAATMAADRAADLDAERESIRVRLTRDLRWTLAALAEPLGGGETAEDREHQVTSGNEINPGVYRDGGEWIAWDYEPDTETGDPVTVRAGELSG